MQCTPGAEGWPPASAMASAAARGPTEGSARCGAPVQSQRELPGGILAGTARRRAGPACTKRHYDKSVTGQKAPRVRPPPRNATPRHATPCPTAGCYPFVLGLGVALARTPPVCWWPAVQSGEATPWIAQLCLSPTSERYAASLLSLFLSRTTGWWQRRAAQSSLK